VTDKYLLIGDLHLTEKPRDAYRFDIFKWIRKQQREFEPKATIFMGDLTDKVDKHPAVLVNRVVNELQELEKFYIVMGNHDYVDSNNPFFMFLGPSFIHEPTQINRLLFIPHTYNEDQFAQTCKSFSSKSVPAIDYVFCHQTFDGAIAETGTRLNGFRPSHIDVIAPRLGAYAGDVHRPQRAANVVYVGSPYHIRFGDDFDPRCILLDDGHPKNLYFETVHKWSLTIKDPDDILKNKQLYEGDQVKLTVELAKEETFEWQKIRRDILEATKTRKLEVFGIDLKVNSATPRETKLRKVDRVNPDKIYSAFCSKENLPSNTRRVGRDLLACSTSDT